MKKQKKKAISFFIEHSNPGIYSKYQKKHKFGFRV